MAESEDKVPYTVNPPKIKKKKNPTQGSHMKFLNLEEHFYQKNSKPYVLQHLP